MNEDRLQFWSLYVGGAFAVTGALTFAVVLTRFHGRGALMEW